MREYILFDLDGTLTDPKEGITKAVRYTLNHYGIQVDDLDSLCPFIGPPLTDSFERFYGFSPEQARESVSVYREYYLDAGWKQNLEYEGVKEMLGRLQAAGKHLLVATSKPEVTAVQILKHFKMDGFFELIGGADLEGKRVKKGDVIRYVLARAGLSAGAGAEPGMDADIEPGMGTGTEPERMSHIIMVGDREHDVLGARELGMDCVGVLYGYGSREEFEACGAFAVVETVEELEEFLMNCR